MIAHMLLVSLMSALCITATLNPLAIASYKLQIATNVIAPLIDILMCCMIWHIIYEGNQVKLVQSDKGTVEVVEDQDWTSSDEESETTLALDIDE